FHEEKAPVWKSVDKPLQAALKADLIVRHPRAVIVIVGENVGFLAIALARRLPLPVADQDHNSQRRALSKEFDEFDRKIVEPALLQLYAGKRAEGVRRKLIAGESSPC